MRGNDLVKKVRVINKTLCISRFIALWIVRCNDVFAFYNTSQGSTNQEAKWSFYKVQLALPS
jgi:hypothetical protein